MRLRAQTPQVCCFASVACSLSCAVLATLLILALHAPRPARDGLFGDGLALSHHPEACDYAGMPLGIRTGRPSASSCGRWTAEWSSALRFRRSVRGGGRRIGFEAPEATRREHGVWVQVDAAYASSVLVCPEFTYVIDCVEAVDSFSMNATSGSSPTTPVVLCGLNLVSSLSFE